MRTSVALIGLPILLISLGMTAISSSAEATDWLTMPSTYTHDQASGRRVSQYAAVPAPTSNQVSNFRTSGYTHTRSSLNYGASADNYHRVERWGDPVRPYGEWRFPYRPYSTPYPNWGAPYAGLNLGFGGGFVPGYGSAGGPGVGGPGFGGPGVGGPGFGGPGFGGPGPGAPGFGGPNSGGLNPYPTNPRSAYPDPPYFDGYHPTYRD